jgi:hypothetical protein
VNWDIVAALGEVAGATGVIVSLLYLAGQIAQNTKAIRRAASHEAVEGMLNWFSLSISDPELTRIWTKGIESLDNLTEDDLARFAILQFNLMKVAEDIHYQHLEGGMDSVMWSGWEAVWQQYLGAPGSRAYWVERRLLFSEPFRDYIDGLKVDPNYARTRDFALQNAEKS